MALIISLLLMLWLTTALGVVGLCRLAQRGDAAQLPRAVSVTATRRRRPARLRGTRHGERPLARRSH